MRRFTTSLLAIMLGMHWAALQSVGWMTMLVSFSVDASFGEAVVKTFDGNHPCRICIAVQEGRQTEKEQEKITSLDKSDWLLTHDALTMVWPSSIDLPSSVRLAPPSFSRPPPAPPPRIG